MGLTDVGAKVVDVLTSDESICVITIAGGIRCKGKGYVRETGLGETSFPWVNLQVSPTDLRAESFIGWKDGNKCGEFVAIGSLLDGYSEDYMLNGYMLNNVSAFQIKLKSYQVASYSNSKSLKDNCNYDRNNPVTDQKVSFDIDGDQRVQFFFIPNCFGRETNFASKT